MAYKKPPEHAKWKPGFCPNPGGQPSGKRISTWMVELSQLPELPDPKTLPIGGQIAVARLRAAMNTKAGERSTEIILDRTEGSVAQNHNVNLAGDRVNLSDEELDAIWKRRQSK